FTSAAVSHNSLACNSECRRRAQTDLCPPTTGHYPPTTAHCPPTTDHRPPTTAPSRLDTEMDDEARAPALGNRADYIQAASEVVDSLLHNGQTQSRSSRLGRKERLKNFALVLGGKPRSFVSDR